MDEEESALDKDAIEHDIAAGAKAFRELKEKAGDDWQRWSATILGLRSLCLLAYERAGTTDRKSQAYRDAMSYLLTLRKYDIYDQMDKQTRSDSYRLMDRLDDIDLWYDTLTNDDKMRWKHPSTIAKHCPKQYLLGGRGHNKPPKANGKKPAVSAETERLKALLMQVLQHYQPYDPEYAREMMGRVHLAEHDDGVDNV